MNDIMDKLTIIIAIKRMPFAFLERDHPVNLHITLLKAENPNDVMFSREHCALPYTMCDDERYIQALQGEWARRSTRGGMNYCRGLRRSCLRHKVSSIILASRVDADRIIRVNDPSVAAYSTKDDERYLYVQGKAHVPNTYMKWADPFPVPKRSKRCCIASATGSAKCICRRNAATCPT